jgi:hypothetical protein
VELVAQAADFLKEAGMEQPTNDDIGQGIEIMITTILQKFGVNPEQMQQMVNQYSNENIPAPNEMGGQNA